MVHIVLRKANSISYKQLSKQGILPVYGDGLTLDWLYVVIIARAIDMVINNGILGKFILGGHNERTNITIVKTIIEYYK